MDKKQQAFTTFNGEIAEDCASMREKKRIYHEEWSHHEKISEDDPTYEHLYNTSRYERKYKNASDILELLESSLKLLDFVGNRC